MSRAIEQVIGTDGNDPTHPVTIYDGSRNHIFTGLSKREHFAAMAMQGMTHNWGFGHSEACAKEAVAYADALIAELSKPVQPKPDVGADIESYLAERSEWLTREIKNGGDSSYLGQKRSEVDYILKNVREIRARVQP